MPILRLGIDARGAKKGAADFNAAAATATNGANQATEAMKRLAAAIGIAFSVGKTLSVIQAFEDRMTELRAVTGSSADEMARFAKVARELGATTRFSAAEAADGLLLLGKAGFSASAAVDAISSTLNLAAATNIQLARATDVTINIMGQFGLQAKETERIVDVLVSTANATITEVDGLADAMVQVGPIARTMGISLEETAAALGALGDQGIQAQKAGTGLRAVFASLANPVGEAADLIEDLKIKKEDLDITTRGLIPVLDTLAENIKTPTQLFQLFGREAASVGSIVIDSRKRIEELTGTIKGAGGVTRELAEAMTNTLSGKIKGLMSVIEELMLQTGDAGLLGIMRDLIDLMTEMFRVMGGLNDETKKLSTGVNVLTKAFEGLLVVSTGVIALKTTAWLIAVGAAAVGAAAGVTILTAAIAGLTAGVIGIQIGRLLFDEFKWVQEIMADFVHSFMNDFAFVESIVKKWGVIFVHVWEKAINAIKSLFRDFLNWLIEYLESSEGALNLIGIEIGPALEVLGQKFHELNRDISNTEAPQALAGKLAAVTAEFEKQLALNRQIRATTQETIDAAFPPASPAGAGAVGNSSNPGVPSIIPIGMEEIEKAAFEGRANLLKENQDLERDTWNHFFRDVEAMNLDHNNVIQQQDAMAAEHMQELWAAGFRGKMAIVGGIMNQFSVLMESKSRKMFEVGKAAAYASTVVNTAEAAMAAYKAMAGIPIVGPALGVAAAGAAIAAGAVQMQKISAASFGGKGGGSGNAPAAPAVSSPGNGAFGSAGSSGTSGSGNTRNVTIELVGIEDDNFYSGKTVRKWMDAVAREVGDNA